MLLLILFILISAIGAVLLAARLAAGFTAVLLGVGLFCALYLALVVLFLLVLYISSLFVDLSKPQTKQSAYFRFLANQFLWNACLYGGVRIHATGLELVPRDKPFLLVSNHIYDYDPIIFILAMPWAKLGFISKKENYTMFVVNKLMHKLECVPVDRENDRAALRSILHTADILKAGKHSMGVFPEGYESKSGELLPFRNGVFKIAQRANVPIVVSVLRGTKDIPKNLFRRRTDVELEVLGVVPTEDITGVLTRDIGDRIHKMMLDALERKSAV